MGTSLEAFAAPASLRVLEQEAFYGCKDLKKVIFFQSVARVPAWCFADSGLECVIFRKTGEGTLRRLQRKDEDGKANIFKDNR